MASTAEKFSFDFNIDDYSSLLKGSAGSSAAPQRAPVRKPLKKPFIIKEKPRSKEELRLSAKYSLITMLKTFFVSAVILFFIGTLIFGRVKVVDYAAKAQELSARYDEAVSENVRLSSEVASKYSAGNISDYAENELGMVKKDDFQINYFSVD